MLIKQCHTMLDQISDERLEDVLKLLTEMRDRKTNDYVTYMNGIPIYQMGNKAHTKRLLMQTSSSPIRPIIPN
ncbi:hypothetical protein [Anaerospora sp.]|uniref:hypothetical protein n=1 Tax=Anaerospora sp. TaxID=1960278 RepID=UPI00289CEA52|nr:hypothetical protein [Anaerospora sp.]